MEQMLCWLYWNPSREIVHIPLINHPVTWYGVFFALGFALCYFLLVSILKKELSSYGNKAKDMALILVDRLLWYIVIGTLIGARLGEVLFYDFPIFWKNPLEILMVWHGGLASHGAAIGIMTALYLFYIRKKDFLPGSSFLDFMDIFVIPTPIAFACIRLGNFVNQEILGVPSKAPWAIIFGNPVARQDIVPRHPVMLYEALAYISLFVIIYSLWRFKDSPWGSSLKTGVISGVFFVLAFSARFVLEFFKVAQTDTVLIPGLDMGQVLSIPFIIIGLALLWRAWKLSPAPPKCEKDIS